MRQIAYPTGAHEARVRAISDSLRAQAQDLNDASHRAVQQVDTVRALLLRHTEDLAGAATRIETDTAQAVEIFGRHVGELATTAEAATERTRATAGELAKEARGLKAVSDETRSVGVV